MEYSLLEKQILKLEKRLMNYEYNDFIELLADEFLEFGSSGKSYNKEVLLAVVKGINTNSIKKIIQSFSFN